MEKYPRKTFTFKMSTQEIQKHLWFALQTTFFFFFDLERMLC